MITIDKNRIQKALSCVLLAMPLVTVSAKDVKGTVTDAATGKPLVGVSVQAYNNPKFSAMTDKDGNYSITVPDYVNSLFLKLEGSEPQQVAIGKDTEHVNATLFSEAFSTTYTSSISGNRAATAEGFQNSAEQSIDPFISQRLGSDVRSVGRGGMPGVGNAMFISGINSLSANAQPLIVLDGVIMDMQYNRNMLHDGYYNNILANLNVNDIDKVEVLKNGTAIYGAKGANGVILITTQRNKSMATKIDVTISGKYELQPRTASMLEASDYRSYSTELLSSLSSNIGAYKFLNSDPKYYYYNQYHQNTDWKKEVYKNAFTQNYGIKVSGGDNVANYNLSVGYSLADATLKTNDFSRFDMRLNTDISILRNLDVHFDAAFSDVKRSLFDVGVNEDITNVTSTAPSFLALAKSPFLSPYAMDIYGKPSTYFAEADDYLEGSITSADRSLANPTSILANGEGDNRNSFGNRLVMFSATPVFRFNKHLSLQEAFNFTLVNTNENYYLPLTGVPSFRVPGLADRVYVNNVVQSLASRQNSIQSDTRLTWNNRFKAHYINVFGGVRYIHSSYRYTKQRGYNSPSDKSPNMSSTSAYKSVIGDQEALNEVAWYASADYNYAEKYYFTAGLSAQASSRFGKEADGIKAFGTRWGLFPSAQASYVITNEPWLAGKKGLDYLRLNVGIDVTGNDDIDYRASRTYFVSHKMLSNAITGKVFGNIGNANLTWETTKRLTAGFEGNFFGNRLHVGFNYFKSWTSNLLTLAQLSYLNGNESSWVNDGKLQNTGFDANFSVKALSTRDWNWELGASVGHYKNKVTALSNNNAPVETNIYDATILTKVGGPVGLFYGYKTEKVFSNSQEAQNSGLYYIDGSNNKVYFQAGDVQFADIDGNKCIDENDRVVIGDPNPDIYGNIFTRLTWKRFTLDATMTYSLGNDVYNYERSILESGKYFLNQTSYMKNRWTTENQVTDIPRASYLDPNGNSRFSDRWIEDGSYLRLSNVTLSYTLPINWVFLQGITIWGAANNLFTITKYLGSNPDVTVGNNVLSQGIDRGLLGVGRSFAMGVKINL